VKATRGTSGGAVLKTRAPQKSHQEGRVCSLGIDAQCWWNPDGETLQARACEIMNPTEFPLLVFVLSFLLLWLSEWIGSRLRKTIEDVHEDFAVILTATLTLLSLILGFAFSMAVSRYDQRKLYEEQEANAIGTEYLRIDLLPLSDGENPRILLREYLDQRVLFYQTRDPVLLRYIDGATAQLQTKLWASVRGLSSAQQTATTALAISGMNQVFDSQGSSQAAWGNRIPVAAWTLMGVMAISGNLMIGLYLRRLGSNGILLMVLPAIVSLSFLLIADIDSPRGGLIHIKPENLIRVAHSLGT
jgi:hypothetical protein